jgi:hypothetical protein
MLDQLQDDYSKLDFRVRGLETGMTDVEMLQADYAALSARVDALEGSGSLLFESDFSGSPLGSIVQTTNIPVKAPTAGGFDGYNVSPNSDMQIVDDGAGRVLRLEYNPGQSQPSLSLYKHLGDETNLQEIYLEMEIKWSDGFVIGTYDGNNGYHKIYRAWQNTTFDGSWSGEANRGYVVGNYNYEKATGIQRPCLSVTGAWKDDNESNNGSVNGPRVVQQYWGGYNQADKTTGHLEPHTGSQNGDAALPVRQVYHKFQWRIKLAQPGQADGYLEMWIDGIKQRPFTHPTAKSGASQTEVNASDPNRLFTESKGGFKLLTLFDNMQFVSSEWTEQHYLFLKSVKVSTEFIG